MGKNLRIAYFHYGIFEGGDNNGWKRTYNLAKGLSEIGHEVVLFTTLDSKNRENISKNLNSSRLKVRAFRDFVPNKLRTGGFSFFAAFLKVIFLIKNKSFDICICDNVHRPACLIPAIYLRYFQKVHVISEWWEYFGRGGIFSEMSFISKSTVGLYDILFEKTIRKYLCSGISAISTLLAKEASLLGFSEDEICVLWAGIDKEILACNENKLVHQDTKINKKIKLGLIGANENEIRNNRVIFDACYELRNEGMPVEILCSGNLIIKNPELKKFSNIINVLGWVKYDIFIKEMSDCDGYILFQDNTLRNQARFPNKLGDYLGMNGFILSNCVGDLKFFVEKDMGVIKIERKNDVKIFLSDFIVGKNENRINKEVLKKNTWAMRSKTLSQFITRFV